MTGVSSSARAVVVAQFSDLHVMAEGARNRYGIEATEGLVRCMAHLPPGEN